MDRHSNHTALLFSGISLLTLTISVNPGPSALAQTSLQLCTNYHTAGSWKRGCRGSAGTTGYWQLQAFQRRTNNNTGGTTAVVTTSQTTTGETTGGGARNHGLVRGWARIANGTIVAEDGSILRGVHMHAMNIPYFSNTYKDVDWWRNIHDIGHFNVVRVMGYTGDWYGTGSNVMDLPTLEGILDIMVANAKQAGMYVIIGNFTGSNRGIDWNSNTPFWTAIAPRYKTDTNVIFEIQNEPDMGGWGGIPEHENSLYQLIRSYAPNTPIIAWSVSTTSGVDILGMLGRGNQINYSNAAFGFHVYGGMSVASTKDMISEVRNAGYPVISTEFAVDGYSPDGLIDAFEATQTSWVVLTDGFCDAATGACYGANSPQTLKITWPKDYTAERSQ